MVDAFSVFSFSLLVFLDYMFFFLPHKLTLIAEKNYCLANSSSVHCTLVVLLKDAAGAIPLNLME